MIIFLSTWLYEESQGEALTRAGYRDRLLSYYHTRDRGPEAFREYVKTGVHHKEENREALHGLQRP